MSTMVEKVARALCIHSGFDPETMVGVSPFKTKQWCLHKEQARAAIEAMMEPTPVMLAAGEDEDTFMANGVLVERSDAGHHYAAMIQAALKEQA